MHLGDIIVTLNILYNHAIQEKRQITILGQNQDEYKQLCKIFDYEKFLTFNYPTNFVLRPNGTEGAIWQPGYHTTCFADFLEKYYLNICFGLINKLPKTKLQKFLLPEKKIDATKEDFLVFQFLPRSPDSIKSFTEIDSNLSLNKFAKKKSICIGGPDTKKYLKDYDAYFDTIENLAKKMLQSSGFFGIDSGMSHLAGTLKINGDVIIQANDDDFLKDVQNSYQHMYPTLNTHSKQSLK